MKLLIGTSGFAYPQWKGKFYPEDLPAKQMLKFYAEHFPAVEINYTFNRLPTPELLNTWKGQVSTEFMFCLKAPQRITHIKRLRGVEDIVTQFFEVSKVLEKRNGPCLFQLPPNFAKDAPRLKEFLKLLPSTRRAAFEFRHQSWFDDEVLTLLRQHKAALCIADESDELKVPVVATTDWGYVRLRRERYAKPELKQWAKQLQELNWREGFLFFRHDDDGKGTEMATSMLEIVSQ